MSSMPIKKYALFLNHSDTHLKGAVNKNNYIGCQGGGVGADKNGILPQWCLLNEFYHAIFC